MLHILKKSTRLFARINQPPELIWQRVQSISVSAVYHFENFIDKEFAKAQRDLDTDTLDDPAALLKKLERDQKRRIHAAKRARYARSFRPAKEPRILSRDTMEQIRYLRQEKGEEWSIKELAASFGITEALVVKVLKSKFVPTQKRLEKQDARAKANAGLLPEKTMPGVTGHAGNAGNKTALLSAFTKSDPTNIRKPGLKATLESEKTVARKSLEREDQSDLQQQPMSISGQIRGQRSGQRSEENLNTVEESVCNQTIPHTRNKCPETMSPARVAILWDRINNPTTRDRQQLVDGRDLSLNSRFKKGSVAGHQSRHHNSRQREENMVLTVEGTDNEEELDIDMENLQHYYDESPPPRIIRSGNEFYDEDGNFLYRL
ncbi:LOW QUALITY PROTEIN: neugrin-like [Acanthaster planci]|uniref:LOW QUALITY PROTEIN: neugrin-like n=1 Tax=Acanthaster planci TaxID=133434 RepID=A0A8B7ZXA1_ACAPL|nr:LOW QUALITY PROTEIN: neugrin-like [Acanthaster planci]